MDDLVILALAISLLFKLVCLPLALGKIKPNRFYGLRFESTLQNEKIWYLVNASFGRWTLGLLTVFDVILLMTQWLMPRSYGILALGFLQGLLLLAVVRARP